MKSKNRTLRHWVVVAVCCGLYSAAIGLTMNCMGVFFTPLADSFGVGRGNVAVFSTIINLLGGFFAPVAVKLIERFRLKPVLLAGSILVSGGLAAMSFARSVAALYCIAPVVGIGAALIGAVPITALLGSWFRLKYGLATGIALSFSGVSGAVLSPLFSSIIASAGWRTAFLVMGAIGAVITIPGVLFGVSSTPEDRGLWAYGAEGPALREEPDPAKFAGAKKQKLLTPTFWGCALFVTGGAMVTGFNSHFPGYAGEMGLAASVGALMTSASMIGNLTGKLVLGAIADRLGEAKSCLIMFALHLAAMVLLTLLPVCPTAVYFGLAFCFGAIYSVMAVGVPMIVRSIYGTERYSSVYSMLNLVQNVGTAIMIAAIGYIYDFFGSYRVATGVCVVLAALSAAAMLAVAGRKERL